MGRFSSRRSDPAPLRASTPEVAPDRRTPHRTGPGVATRDHGATDPGPGLWLDPAEFGQALLDVELALSGEGALDEVAAGLVRLHHPCGTGAPTEHRGLAGLFGGVAGMLLVLDAACADGRIRRKAELGALDKAVESLVTDRLTAAADRHMTGLVPTGEEFDLLEGLIGLGTLLLRRRPHSPVTANVVGYVVDLTKNRRWDDTVLPGWWASPDLLHPERGSAELGLAHGAAGLLAFLTIAIRSGHGTRVPHQAVKNLVDWLTTWQQDGPDGIWWPAQLSLDEIRTGNVTQQARAESWSRGGIGIARALQMAAIVTADTELQVRAEKAVVSCLAPARLARVTGPGLYAGTAGIYQTAVRAAQDAISPVVLQRLATAAESLSRTGRGWPDDASFWTGRAGTRLANQTLTWREPPFSGWDRYLLIAWMHA